MIDIEARNARRKTAIETINQSFSLCYFDDIFIQEIKLLVLDDVHLSEPEIKRRNWQVVHADDNSGAIDVESRALIDWWRLRKINPVYATSRQRLIENQNNNVLVMKLTEIDTGVLNQIDLGMWMFGKIPDLAAQRISDWRADIWFFKSA